MGSVPPLRLWIAWLDPIYWWRRARGDGHGEGHTEIEMMGSTCNTCNLQSILLDVIFRWFSRKLPHISSLTVQLSTTIGWRKATMFVLWMLGNPHQEMSLLHVSWAIKTNCLERLLSYCMIISSQSWWTSNIYGKLCEIDLSAKCTRVMSGDVISKGGNIW